MTVVGIKHVDYFSKKKNRQVTGVEVYTQYESKNVDGYAVEKIYLSLAVIEKCGGYIPQINDNIDVLYNQYGSVAAVYQIEG